MGLAAPGVAGQMNEGGCFSQNVPPCVWNQPKLTGTYRQGNSSSDLDPFSLKSTLLHFGAFANNTVSNMFDSVAIP